jgi:hypothetical protein
MDLLGNDALQNEDKMRKMWRDSMQAVNCNHARITYGDFLLLMKGQTRDAADLEARLKEESSQKVGGSQLLMVPEEKIGFLEDSLPKIMELPDGDKISLDGAMTEPKVLNTPLEASRTMLPIVPLTPIRSRSLDDREPDTPLSMDDDDGMAPSPSTMKVVLSPGHIVSLTPPVTPTRGPRDFISAKTIRKSATELMLSSPDLPMDLPDLHAIPKPQRYVRKRSRSMDDTDTSEASSKEEPLTPSFAERHARLAVALTENDPKKKELIGNEKNKIVLQVNRKLYRAHRQMRLSVLEASKRFEEQQTRHAHDVLLAQQTENDANHDANEGLAGLVMRRVQNKTVLSAAVKKILEDNQKEQQSLMELANRRGGRGRRARKKTISDMSGMMGSLSQDDLHKISIEAATPSRASSSIIGVEQGTPLITVPTVIETVSEETELLLRGSTIPGAFRKVNDPFGTHGKYGHLS